MARGGAMEETLIETHGPRESRGCLPTLAVALLMAAIVGGGLFAAGALRDRPAVPVGVGEGVSVAPQIEWQFVARIDPPAGGSEGVLLTRGNGGMLVFTSPASAEDQLAQLRDELAAGPMSSVSEIALADIPRPEHALRFAFSGALPEISAAPIEGEATAVQGSRSAVIFLAWADVGDYPLLRGDAEALIVGAVIP